MPHAVRCAAVLVATIGTTVLAANPGLAASPARAASPVRAAPAPAVTPPASSDEVVEVTLLDLSPLAPTASEVLTISGTATNRSEQPLTNLNAYLRMSSGATTDRAGIARLVAPDFRASFRPGPYVALGAELAPGASVSFQLDVPVAELNLSTPGVYPVGIEVLAGFEDGTRRAAGRSITIVPWLGGAPDASTEVPQVPVAAVVPLSAPVDRAPDGSYLSDDLGAALAPAGALGALVDASATPGSPASQFGAAVTWLVDPAVIEAAADLSDGYDVRADPTDAATLEPGNHSADAAAWLEQVVALADAGAVALLPYGDVDLVALIRAGLGADAISALALGPSRVEAALAAAGRTTDEALAVRVLYPPGGAVDAATLAVLADAGVRTLLLSDAAVTGGTPDPQDTSEPVVQLDTAAAVLTAVVTDATLDGVLAVPGGPLEARQLALAHTALAALAAARSTAATPLVVVPLASPPDAVGALEVLTGAVPWVRPVNLLDSIAGASGPTATPDYPQSATDLELPPGYLDAVADLEQAAATLTSLTRDETTAAELVLARLRTESAGWRDDIERGAQLVAAHRDAVDDALGRVRIVTTGTVTLSSDAGRFPVTVANDMDQPVTVRLSLTSDTPARLQATAPQLVEIAAGTKTTVDVSAQATSNGVYRLNARLQTADGVPFGTGTPITLRATQYDTVAWIVMGVAGGLIFVGSGLRLLRRARASRAARA